MTGWKSKLSGVGIILGGLALVIKGVTADGFDFDSVKQGIAAVLAGLAILGIAHKLDKGPQS